ncbi:MAG: hypothetical protein WC469_05220, partial [Candidatus Omnitrophota bacterium]
KYTVTCGEYTSKNGIKYWGFEEGYTFKTHYSVSGSGSSSSSYKDKYGNIITVNTSYHWTVKVTVTYTVEEGEIEQKGTKTSTHVSSSTSISVKYRVAVTIKTPYGKATITYYVTAAYKPNNIQTIANTKTGAVSSGIAGISPKGSFTLDTTDKQGNALKIEFVYQNSFKEGTSGLNSGDVESSHISMLYNGVEVGSLDVTYDAEGKAQSAIGQDGANYEIDGDVIKFTPNNSANPNLPDTYIPISQISQYNIFAIAEEITSQTPEIPTVDTVNPAPNVP